MSADPSFNECEMHQRPPVTTLAFCAELSGQAPESCADTMMEHLKATRSRDPIQICPSLFGGERLPPLRAVVTGRGQLPSAHLNTALRCISHPCNRCTILEFAVVSTGLPKLQRIRHSQLCTVAALCTPAVSCLFLLYQQASRLSQSMECEE